MKTQAFYFAPPDVQGTQKVERVTVEPVLPDVARVHHEIHESLGASDLEAVVRDYQLGFGKRLLNSTGVTRDGLLTNDTRKLSLWELLKRRLLS